MKAIRVVFLFSLFSVFLNDTLQAQTLSHKSGYFTMYPYNDSYDDGSYAKIFYDGNERTVRFWNSDDGGTKITAHGFTSSDWYRVLGDSGLFFQKYGGGFHMTDNAWIRTYGDKNFYHNKGIMRTDGRFEVGPTGDRFSVAQNGNVGIGLTSPEYKLHVSTGVQFRKTTIGVTVSSADNGWIRDEWMTGAYGPTKWNEATKKWVRPAGEYNDIGGIVWQDEGTYFIRDKAGTKTEYTNQELLDKSFLFADIFSGNVGIGSDLSDVDFRNYKLSVNGRIRATEVKVYTGWADYVFKEDYKLPTLKEVAQHIAEKGHLINIPSAAEVAENGIQLGEMNAKLLEKIEELTLYTLEQEKKLQTQEERLQKLEKLLLEKH